MQKRKREARSSLPIQFILLIEHGKFAFDFPRGTHSLPCEQKTFFIFCNSCVCFANPPINPFETCFMLLLHHKTTHKLKNGIAELFFDIFLHIFSPFFSIPEILRRQSSKVSCGISSG